MNRVIAIILALGLLLSSCSNGTYTNNKNQTNSNDDIKSLQEKSAEKIEFSSLSDKRLLQYVEDDIYANLNLELDDKCVITNVSAIYVSKEYIDELEFNSRENIYFGYTLKEIEESFAGKKYVFTVDDSGKTIVKEFEEYDDSYERALKNIAIGSGVILVCVTVSVVSGGAGAPAISAIFAASAKTGTAFALSSGTISGVFTGIVKGIETGDMNEAIKAGVVSGSESFKWGALSGAVIGGGGEAIALHGATLNGLTMNQVAQIQKETRWSLDIIKNLHSMDEYYLYKKLDLIPFRINNHIALIRNIDLTTVQKDGLTNAQRIQNGLSPYDPNGGTYELHHIGQNNNSPLAILEQAEHQGNYKILNFKKHSNVDHGPDWQKIVTVFWKDYLQIFNGG